MFSQSLAVAFSWSHCTPAARTCTTLCPGGQRRKHPNLLASGEVSFFVEVRDDIAPMMLMVNALMPQLPSLLVVSSSTMLFTASSSCKEAGQELMGPQAALRGRRPA